MTKSYRPNRERGAALLLAFLALMVLVVVIGQVSVSSRVDRSIALNSLKDVRFDYAAKGAFEIAKSLLLRDLKDEQAESGAGGDGQGGGFGNDDELMSGGGDEEQKEPNDSLLDYWADESQTKQQFGEGIEVRIRIVDEDRKLNLLGLVAEDEGFRGAYQDRVIRVIDSFREDSRHDVSYGKSTDIADAIEKWLRGERENNDVPIPRMTTDQKEDDGLVFSEEILTGSEEERIVYPLSMEELLHIDEIDEFLLRGFMEGDRYVPGLEDVFTVFSNLAFDDSRFEDPEEDEEEFQNPFESDEEEPEGQSDEEPPTDSTGALLATETNQGRVNVNTAPLAVLRAMMPNEEIPFTVIEKIHEFRLNAWDDDIVSRAQARAAQFKYDDEDEEGGPASVGDDDFGQDPADFTFSTTDDVIDRVQEYYNARFDLTAEQKSQFANTLAVKSHVFTVFLELRATGGANSGGDRDALDWTPPERIYRSVVWRRAAEKLECITLVPLHPWTGVVPPDTEDYRKDYPYGF